MTFQMKDIHLSNPVVAAAIAGCLRKCDRALNELLVETKEIMPESDWNLLRRGVAEIVVNDMADLWSSVVKSHPRYEEDAFGKPTEGQQ